MPETTSVQMRLDFITDESQALKKTIDQSNQLTDSIGKTRKEIAQLERALKDAAQTESARAQQKIGVQAQLETAQKKLTEANQADAKAVKAAQKEVDTLTKALHDLENQSQKNAEKTAQLASAQHKLAEETAQLAVQGAKTAQLNFNNVAPAQLYDRLKQIKQQINEIPPALRTSSQTAIQLTSEANAIKRALSDAEKEAKKLQQNLERPASNSWIDFTAKLALAFQMLQRLWSAIWSPSEQAAALEQATTAFTTFLKSPFAAEEMMTTLRQKASLSPFTTEDYVVAARKLLAYNFSAKQTIDTLGKLEDVAAGAKVPLGDLAAIYGKAKLGGLIQAQDLNQLSDRGIPIISELAKVLKVSEDRVKKLGEEGKIQFAHLEKAFVNLTSASGLFFGASADQSRTMTGLLSTLKDNVDNAKIAFGQGFNEIWKQVIQNSVAFSNALDTEKLKDWGRSVGQLVRFFIDWVPVLARVIVIWGAYSAAVSAAATVTRLMSATFTASPIGMWAALVMGAVQAVQYFAAKTGEMTAYQKDLNDATQQATRLAAENRVQSDALFAVLRDGTATMEQQKKAKEKILALYPQHLGNIKTHTDLANRLDEAQKRVNQGIIEEALARIKAEKMQQKTSEIMELRLQKTEMERKRLSALSSGEGNYDFTDENTGERKTGNAKAEAIQADMAVLDAKIAQSGANLEQFGKDFNKAGAEMANTLKATVMTPFKIIDTEIAEVSDQIAKTTDKIAKKALQDRLEHLKAERSREIDRTVDNAKTTTEIKATIDKKAIKEQEHREKEHHELQLKEAEIQYRKLTLINDRDFAQKKVGKSKDAREALDLEHDGAELVLTQKFYDDKAVIHQAYKGKLKKTDADYAALEVKILEDENKIQAEKEKLDEKTVKAKEDAEKKREEIERKALQDKKLAFETEQKIATETYQKISLDNEKALFEQSISQSQYEKADLTAKVAWYEAQIKQHKDYNEKLKGNDKERLDNEIALFEKEKKLAETRNALKTNQLMAKNSHIQLDAEVDVAMAMPKQLNVLSDDKAIREQQLQEQKFKHLLTLEHAYQIEKARIQNDAYQRQLDALKAAGLNETKEYAELLKLKHAADKNYTQSKKDLAALEKQIDAAKVDTLRDSFALGLELMNMDATAKRKNADGIKAFQIAQIITNGVLEVQKIWAQVAEYGPWGVPIGAAMTAFSVVRSAMAIKKVESAKMERGGTIQFLGGNSHATGGTQGFFSDGTQIEAEKDEAVVVVNKKNAPMLQALSNINGYNGHGKRFFQYGGFAIPNTTPSASLYNAYQYTTHSTTYQPSNDMTQVFYMLLAQSERQHQELKSAVEKGREVKFYRNQLEDLQAADASDIARSNWQL